MTRREEVAAGLAATRQRIAEACDRAGRDHDEVTLVVVTKYFPFTDVELLHSLGLRDVGESRHPEALDKSAALAGLDLTWHFIGNLQTNKATAVASYVDVLHSLDRAKLLPGLSRGAQERGRVLDVLVQVDLDDVSREGRGGARPADVPSLAEQVLTTEGLRLLGVMAVAPLGADAHQAFARLAKVARAVQAVAPEATWVSAGMSGDLEAAIAAGATHVRVGSAVLGSRVPGR